MRPFFAAGLLLVALTAFASMLEVTWNEQGRYETTITVPPGRFAEVCGKLDRGHSVDWKFRSSAPTEFNIHYHLGKDVVYPAQKDNATEAGGRLNVEADADYCWMWTSKEPAPVRLTLSLQRS